MLNYFKQFYNSQKFHPGVFGVLVNPFYTTRRLLYKEIRFCANKMRGGGKLLDIGCGAKPYRALFDMKYYWGVEVVKFGDRTKRHCDVSYDGMDLPFLDKSLDYIIMNQVLEHVSEPQHLLAEIYRILKPQGMLLITAPLVWDEHGQPNDFGRYTSFGIKYLLERNDFVVDYFKKNGSYLNTITQMISSYVYTVVNPLWFPLKAVVYLFICAPIILLGEISTKIFPRNDNLYLDNVILVHKSEAVNN